MILLKNCRFLNNFYQKIAKRKNLLVESLLCFALLIYFIFGFHHLSNFISADEHFWLPNSGTERIEDYWTAIKKGDWKDTRINDKPGITLAYTSGIAMLFDDAKGQIIDSDGNFKRYDPARTKTINFLYRLPILLISGFFSFFFFWIIRRITGNEWIALFSATGILLSPILLGISQIVNPDSLFWIFGSASFFSFYAFLQTQEKKFILLASVFFGLAMASKYVSIIFIPFFLFAIFAYYFFEFEKWQSTPQELKKIAIRIGLAYFAIILSGFLIFALMMPASFVEPKIFYLGTIGFPGMEMIFWLAMAINALVLLDAWIFKSRGLHFSLKKLQPLQKIAPKLLYLILLGTFFFVLVNWLTRNSFIDLSDISFDMKRKDAFSELAFYKRYFMEFVPLVFSLTPIALCTLLFGWIKAFFAKGKTNTFVFTLSVFFLIFYAAVIEQGLLVTVRYSIILFPLALVLGATALNDFFSAKSQEENKKAFVVFIFAFIGITVLFASSTIQQSYFTGALKTVYLDRVYQNWYFIPLFLLLVGGLARAAYAYLPWQKIFQIPKIGIFIILIALNSLSIFLISPFYFSYTNDLLPKNYIISGAWGYGGYEAAEYLNDLPNARNLTIWTDVYGVCEFFSGKCIHKSKINTSKYTIDYYFRSLQATIPLNFPHPMEKHSIWSIYIDDRPESFVKLYKAKPLNSSSTDDNSDGTSQ
ncbi:MAG: glycosyltransferase family 39 protein [Parcubacteria group bacterium]